MGVRQNMHYARALRCNAAGPFQICFLRACNHGYVACYSRTVHGYYKTASSPHTYDAGNNPRQKRHKKLDYHKKQNYCNLQGFVVVLLLVGVAKCH